MRRYGKGPLIRITRNAKDLQDGGGAHTGLTRRDFLSRGLATASMTVLAQEALLSGLCRKARAGTNPQLTTCPAGAQQTGALAQIYRDGGNTRGAMFLTQAQANSMNTNMAANYGILGSSDLVFAGSNYYMAKSSPYAAAILNPPAGYTAANWAKVLKQTSLGAIFGPWADDDAIGQPLGNLGAAAPWKVNYLGKDIRINNGVPLASFAAGIPTVGVLSQPNMLAAGSVANQLKIFPYAGLTTATGTMPAGAVLSQAQFTASAAAADNMGSVFASIFGTASRVGGTVAAAKTICGMYGDAVLANPAWADANFNAALMSQFSNVGASGSAVTVGSLSPEQQALLGAFYASAMGNCGAVVVQQNGNDYHGQPANVIAPVDYEAGQFFQMFLVACDIAKKPGVFIDISNGQAIGGGASATSLSGYSGTIYAPTALFDAGGAFNAGYILFYNPTGAPPAAGTLGTVNPVDGTSTSPLSIASPAAGLATLYLTALEYLATTGGFGSTGVSAAFNQMVAAGLLQQSSSGLAKYLLPGIT